MVLTEKTEVLTDVNYGKRLIGHGQKISQLIELPNGLLASASKDMTVRIWDIYTGRCLHTLSPRSKPQQQGVYKLSNKLLAIFCSDANLEIWNYATGQFLHFIGDTTGYKKLIAPILLPNGLIALPMQNKYTDMEDMFPRLRGLKMQDRVTEIWDPISGKCLHTLENIDFINKYDEDKYNNFIFIDEFFALQTEEAIQLYNINTWKCVRSIKHDFPKLTGNKQLNQQDKRVQTEQVLIALANNQLAMGAYILTDDNYYSRYNTEVKMEKRNLIKIWDIITGECIFNHNYIYENDNDQLCQLYTLPDGQLGVCSINTMQILNISTKNCVHTLENINLRWLRDRLQILPMSHLLLYASGTSIELWDIKTWNKLPAPGLEKVKMASSSHFVTLSNGLLAYSESESDNTIQIWRHPQPELRDRLSTNFKQSLQESDAAEQRQCIAQYLQAKLQGHTVLQIDTRLLELGQQSLLWSERYEENTSLSSVISSIRAKRVKSTTKLALLALSWAEDTHAHTLVYHLLNNTFLNLPFNNSNTLSAENSQSYFKNLSEKKQKQFAEVAFKLLKLHYTLLTEEQNIEPEVYFNSLETVRTSSWMAGLPAMAYYELAAYLAESINYLNIIKFDNFKCMTLYLAIQNQCLPAVVQIQSEAPELFLAPLNNERPIFLAAKAGSETMLYWLLEHTSASIYDTTTQKETLFQVLAMHGHEALKQKLMQDAARSSQRAFAAACQGDFTFVQRLYNTFKFDITQLQEGKTLLFIFLKQRNAQALRWLVDTRQSFLLTEENKTAAAWAYELDWPEGIAILNSLQQESACLLQHAIKQNNLAMFQYGLHKAELDINSTLVDGSTPAMYAVMYNQRQMLLQLIKQGADLSCKNCASETASTLAMRLNNASLGFLLSAYEDPSLLQDIQNLIKPQSNAELTPNRAGFFAQPSSQANQSNITRALSVDLEKQRQGSTSQDNMTAVNSTYKASP